MQELAINQLNNPDAKPFVAWLLDYWHLVPPASRELIVVGANKRLGYAHGAVKDYMLMRYGFWAPLVNRQANPEPLDKELWDASSGEPLTDARSLAVRAHDGAGQRYAGRPYSVHLQGVVRAVRQYEYLLAAPLRPLAQPVAWLHDFVEDGYGTHANLLQLFGAPIADEAQLLVSSTGTTRRERHDDAYYDRLATSPLATFVKLCDRLANVEYGGTMMHKYAREQAHLEAHLDVEGRYPDLLPLLDALRQALQVPLAA